MAVGFSDIVGMHSKSALSFWPVCGACLIQCSNTTAWKWETRNSYTAQQCLRILLSCFRNRMTGWHSKPVCHDKSINWLTDVDSPVGRGRGHRRRRRTHAIVSGVVHGGRAAEESGKRRRIAVRLSLYLKSTKSSILGRRFGKIDTAQYVTLRVVCVCAAVECWWLGSLGGFSTAQANLRQIWPGSQAALASFTIWQTHMIHAGYKIVLILAFCTLRRN